MPVLTGSQRASRTQAQNAVLGVGGRLHGAGKVSAVPTATDVGRLRFEVVLGVDEEAESPVVPDMTTSDTVIGVIVIETDSGSTAAEAATVLGVGTPYGASSTNTLLRVRSRNIGDFVAGTGVMTSTANKEDNTDNFYLVVWSDAAYSATDFAPVV